MPKIITVIATGNPVPFERDPQRQITSERAVAIEKTSYIARRLKDGELREVVPGAIPPVPSAPAAPATPAAPQAASAAGKVN